MLPATAPLRGANGHSNRRMFQRKSKTSERAEHRVEHSQRMTAAPPLADEFPHLRSLTMELGQYDGEGVTRMSQMKQSLNVPDRNRVPSGFHKPLLIRGSQA